MPVKLNSSAGGSVTLDVPATASNTTLNLPTSNGTVLASDGSGNVTFSGTTTFSGNATFNAGLVPSSSFLRNRIINGDMRVDQRALGVVTVNNNNNNFAVDRFVLIGQPSDGVFTVQQSSVSVPGFPSSLLATVTTADASIGSQLYLIGQRIEGFNTSDFAWGTASAQTVTLSFWVRSSVTGTFGGSVTNETDAGYAFTYTISAANTFERKTVTIPGSTIGTWLAGNGRGVSVFFSLGAGSIFSAPAGSWVAAVPYGANGQTQLISTNGATFYLTGVQLEVGSVATPFERRQYGQEFGLCQRYFCSSGGNTEYHVVPAPNATYLGVYRINMPVPMRANPTVNVSYSSTNAVLDFGWYTQNLNYLVHYVTASVSTNAFMFFSWNATSEL